MLKKRGQKTGGHAATVVGIITLILVAYVLFLPPEERELLLEDTLEDGEEAESNGENRTIFEVNQIRLSYVGEDEFEHVIPNIHLRETTAAYEFARDSPFYIRNGWFDKKTRTIDFDIEEPDNTMNLFISFEAPAREGRLIVYFNDEMVYDYEATKLNIGPIEIKNSLLKEKNTVKFEVSGVGLAFWNTNEYAIEEFRAIGDITDVKDQESINTFTVSNEEMYNFESGYLKFWPVCSAADVGRLDVLLNNRMVYSAIPDCNSINRQDIYSTDINSGKNSIIFKTSKGSYRLEQIRLKTELTAIKTFLEYFEVNESDYKDIRANKKDAMLRIEFVDNDENKKADININGHLARIDQTTAHIYEKEISAWVEKGAKNYVEVIPKVNLNIVEIKVVLNEK